MEASFVLLMRLNFFPFFSSTTSHLVWMKISKWLGLIVTLSDRCHSHLLFFKGLFASKNKSLRRVLIWFAAMWEIWLERNNLIFQNEVVDVDYIVENIKRS